METEKCPKAAGCPLYLLIMYVQKGNIIIIIVVVVFDIIKSSLIQENDISYLTFSF